MECRAAVDAGRGRIEAQTEHEVGRVEALEEDRDGQTAVILAREIGQERRFR